MWHNYSRVVNVIMTSSILAFSDDANTKKTCFRLIFFAFDDNDQNNLYSFIALIFIFLKMVLLVILSHCIIL